MSNEEAKKEEQVIEMEGPQQIPINPHSRNVLLSLIQERDEVQSQIDLVLTTIVNTVGGQGRYVPDPALTVMTREEPQPNGEE